MKLGANSVLFGGYDLETAFKYLAMAGYDGIELSAIDGMSEHLVPTRWREQAPGNQAAGPNVRPGAAGHGAARRDPARMEQTMQAAVELGIPIVNCGPGGKTGDEASLQETIDALGSAGADGRALRRDAVRQGPRRAQHLQHADDAGGDGAITSPNFGIDMDPSHIYRADENPVEAIAAVISRVQHVHIRDCKGRQQGPGKPEDQANGRGDIDLVGYVRILHENGYAGPLDLEIIGAKEYSIEQCCTIAAEARGHMQASLQACGAR